VIPPVMLAHLTSTGFGPLYDGGAHLVLSVNDLIPVIAMALLGGLNGAPASRRVLFLLPALWLAGGVAGYLAGRPILPSLVTTASFLLLGGLTAVDPRLSDRAVATLAVVVGVLHGWLNGADMARVGLGPDGLLGIGIAVFVVVALLSALVVSVRTAWGRVVIRVAGSWIAATGILLLGWGIRERL